MAAVLRSAWEVADCTARREAWSNADVAVAVALSSACAAMVATSNSFSTCFDVGGVEAKNTGWGFRAGGLRGNGGQIRP